MLVIDPILFSWLEKQWQVSNHVKYKKYFDQWITNLTLDQLKGFEKIRTADYIKH